MNGIEILIITLGLSLELFATLECQGAMIAKIQKKRLAFECVFFTLWQVMVLYLGIFLAELVCRYDLKDAKLVTGKLIAALIFVCLGIRLILKAWKNDSVFERRIEKISMSSLWKITLTVGIYTLLVGVAFGFLKVDLSVMLIMIAAVTILMVILGIYAGYRLGFEQKNKAYLCGGFLLILGGIDVLVRYII